MRQLKRIIQHNHICRLLDFDDVPALFRFVQIVLPLLILPFVHVATITKRLHGVDVEWVFSHADTRLFRRRHRFLHNLSINFLRIQLQALLLLLLLLFVRKFSPRSLWATGMRRRKLINLQLRLDGGILARRRGKVLTTPNPFHLTQASLTRSVVIARGAYILIDDSRRLQAVRQNNVRVHCCYVQVINQRFHVQIWVVAKVLELLGDLRTNLIVICAVILPQTFSFDPKGVVQIIVEIIQ